MEAQYRRCEVSRKPALQNTTELGEHKMTLPTLKKALQIGSAVEVTNHYITREDHPCVGTNRRTVTTNNSASYGFDVGGKQRWPKASDVATAGPNCSRVYGHPHAGDLFLTIKLLDD